MPSCQMRCAIRGRTVSRTLLVAYTSQPPSSSARAISGVCATCKGVCPDLFAMSTSAFFSSSSCTTSKCPLSDAKYSAVPWLWIRSAEATVMVRPRRDEMCIRSIAYLRWLRGRQFCLPMPAARQRPPDRLGRTPSIELADLICQT